MRISQREARRLKKRVDELERQRASQFARWGSEFPGGVNIDFIDVQAVEYVAVKTAVALGHAVVVRPANQENRILLFAVKP